MITGKLADFVVNLTFDGISSDVQDRSKRIIVRAIANAFAGLATDHGRLAIKYALEFGQTRESTLIGVDGQSSSMNTAFANTVLGLAKTLGTEREINQSAIPIAMSSIAVGECVQACGKDLVVALSAGYEIAIRITEAICPSHHEIGFNMAGTCNTFGTTAVACKLLRLNADQTARAFGLAGSQASGLRQYEVEGTNAVQSFQAGKAALNGVTSALLAQSGFPASPTILEGKYGFCSTFSRKFDPDVLMEGIGERFMVVELPEPTFGDHIEPALGKTRAQALIEKINRVDQLQSVCELTGLLGF